MATIKVIGSSSKGNSYVITSNGHHLIVELGCACNKVLAAIDWRVEKVAGCLASHRPPRRPCRLHSQVIRVSDTCVRQQRRSRKVPIRSSLNTELSLLNRQIQSTMPQSPT